MTDAIGTGSEQGVDGEAPGAMLGRLLDLSAEVLDKAQGATSAMASDEMIAAAESLEKMSRRMRELAGAHGPAAPDTAASPTPQAANEAGGARILLADDLDLNRKLIADMLSLDGHDVDCVSDGAAAVVAVEARPYDLVLMDMVMPGMDGLAATRAIRALRGPARDVPIVALTANALREQLRSCLEAGMNAAVTKPMTIDALTTVVAQWTRGRHAAA